MAFYGDYFTYDGIPCTEYGLRLYEVNGIRPGAATFQLPGDVQEERLPRRYSPLFYGVSQNKSLTFKLVFGADPALVAAEAHFDRWDRENISAWLSPLGGYKWLEIEQPDLEQVRYRCRMENLQTVEMGNVPWAFSVEVKCDGPFAYLYPATYQYCCQGSRRVLLRSLQSYTGHYYPKMTLTLNGSEDISIINHTDGGRVFTLKGLPQRFYLTAEVDNQNGIITSDTGLNLYPYCNCNFLRLGRGDNNLELVGSFQMDITCEFPVSVGG